MQLSALQAAVDHRSGIAWDPTAQVEIINAALAAISAERDWPWLFQTATFTGDGTTTATSLPATWMRTRSVMIGTHEQARPVAIADLDAWQAMDDRASLYGYAVENGQLFIMDAPPLAATVTHRYVRTEPDLVAAGDLPLLPARFHPAVVDYAAQIEAERLGQADKAAAFAVDWERWKKRMVDEQIRNRGPKRVRVRPGRGW